jgi:hypothetical protein
MRSAPAPTETNYDEIAELLRGLARSDSETFKEFIGPERTSGLALPASVWRRFHRPDGVLFNLGPRIHIQMEQYIVKLTKALYYKHFDQIVPTRAAIEYFTVSNAEVGEPHERQIASMRFQETPVLVRCSNARTRAPISDQFQYSYLGSDPPGDAVFKIRFHQAVLVASTVIHSTVDP